MSRNERTRPGTATETGQENLAAGALSLAKVPEPQVEQLELGSGFVAHLELDPSAVAERRRAVFVAPVVRGRQQPRRQPAPPRRGGGRR